MKDRVKFGPPEIIALGEVMVEFFPLEKGRSLEDADTYVRGCAGAAAVYAAAAAKLGNRCALIGRLGNDDFGKFGRKTLEQEGVDTRFLIPCPEGHTSMAFTAYDAGGKRSYVRAHSAGTRFEPKDLDPAWFSACRLLHFPGTTLWISPSSQRAVLKAVKIARRIGALVSCDLNLRPQMMAVSESLAVMRDFWPLIDILKVSEEEAGAVIGHPYTADSLRVLGQLGPRVVAVTLGPAGCVAASAEERVEVPGFSVSEVDPTGAGDTFAAAFTLSLLEGRPLAEAARFANAAGALAVRRVGHIGKALPSREETEDLLDRRVPPSQGAQIYNGRRGRQAKAGRSVSAT